MDSEPSIRQTSKNAERRIWTTEENEAFLCILEELVADGERVLNGTFKSGAIEKATKKMQARFPGTDLNSGHIVNRLKGMTRKYGQVIDMLNTSGFGWDDINKCVVQDSRDVWNAYKKAHPKQTNHVGVGYPEFERVRTIFGRDRATGAHAETAADAVKNMTLNEEETADAHIPFGESPPSVGVHLSGASISSPSSSKKRKSSSDNFGELMGKLDNISGEVTQYFRKIGDKLEENFSKEVWEVLDSLNLTEVEKFDAAYKFGKDSGFSQMLLTMTPARQIGFVMRVIRGGT